MIIHVTQNDIEQGTAGDMEVCPVALAVSRALKEHGLECQVDPEMLYFYRGYFRVWNLKPPRSVTRFVFRFDSKQIVKPFNFRLLNEHIEHIIEQYVEG